MWLSIVGIVLVIVILCLLLKYGRVVVRLLVDLLVYLAGGGALYAVGYFAARLFQASPTSSVVIGLAVPATLGLGRLLWIALGLPTPRRDYNRRRDQDTRAFWN